MKREEIAFLVVFALLFIGAQLIPTQLLDKYEITILLFIVLPFLGWFVGLMAKDIKQNG